VNEYNIASLTDGTIVIQILGCPVISVAIQIKKGKQVSAIITRGLSMGLQHFLHIFLSFFMQGRVLETRT
jgi:hypothetical protein